MTKTINFGIDLGTTNSAIAVWTGNEVKIIKNRYGEDVTPSVVRIDKKGRIYVGKQAYQYMFLDKENVAARFKRYIHLADKKQFPDSQISKDAEELSAEVLKSLLSDASLHIEEPVTAAVITVPAAFTQLQCERTANAAKLAGIENSFLLQEPIAASIAVGLKPDSRDRRWLVYDLGGGTFDVAVISTKDGRLSVLGHRGNNNLGGSDIDEQILRNIVLPNIQEHFKLSDEGSESFIRLYQKLRLKVEELKIDLSMKDICTFSLDEYEQPMIEDCHGNPITIEFDIHRTQIEHIVEPLIQETLQLSRTVLNESRVSPADIDRIILVGGPTRMPLVRAMLGELGIKLDFSVDPMTIVAQGAAVYASTIPISESRKQGIPSSVAASMTLSYEPVWAEVTCMVAGRITTIQPSPCSRYEVRITHRAGHWNSGWIEVKRGYFETWVNLLEYQSNEFAVELRDEKGHSLTTDTESFNIRHGLTTAEPPLPHSLSIELQKHNGKAEFEVIFPRSITLPAEKTLKVQAAKTIKPSSSGEYLAIKLWEDIDGLDREFVGALKIRSDRIARSIPEGSEIELLFKLTRSRILTVEAYVPLLDDTFDRVFTAKENVARVADQARHIAESEIPGFYERLETLQNLSDNPEVNNAIDTLREKVEELEEKTFSSNLEKRAIDPDYDRTVLEKAKDLKLRLAEIEKKIVPNSGEDLERVTLNKDLKSLEDLVLNYGSDLEKNEYELLKRESERALESKSERRISKARGSIKELTWKVLFKQPWFWVGSFERLHKDERSYVDRNEARRFLNQGQAALEKNDIESLGDSVMALWKLLPPDEVEVEKDRSLQAGIRKMRF